VKNIWTFYIAHEPFRAHALSIITILFNRSWVHPEEWRISF